MPVVSMTDYRMEEIGTHDSAFTRGYMVGYFKAKIEDRQSFSCWVIDNQLETLGVLVRGEGEIKILRRKHNKFSVQFTRVRVTF